MDDLAGDDLEDADLQTEVSSMSEAELGSQEDSMTEAIHSPVINMMSTCGYLSLVQSAAAISSVVSGILFQ